MNNKTLSRFATHENSAYPQLWRGCVGAWCPSLGPSGARLHDYSRRNNWATLTNMDVTTDWIISGGAYALDFDGINDNCQANILMVGRTTRMAASCWAWLSGTSLKGCFIRVGFTSGAGNDGFGIGVGSTTMDSAGNNIIGSFEGVRWIATGVAIGTGWHHIGLNIDTSGLPIIYLDGKRVYSDTGATMNTISLLGLVELGGFNQPGFGGFPRYFAGYCDDFRLYDREVSPGEFAILSRRRGIAFTPRIRPLALSQQAATTNRRRRLICGSQC